MSDTNSNNNQTPLPPSGPSGSDSRTPRKGPRFNIYWVYGLIILAIIGLQLFSGFFGSTAEKTMSYYDLQRQLDSGKVAKIVVVKNQDLAEVYLRTNAAVKSDNKHGFAVSDASP